MRQTPTTSSLGNKCPVTVLATVNTNTNITVADDTNAKPAASMLANTLWLALAYAMAARAAAPMGKVYAHHANENLHMQPTSSHINPASFSPQKCDQFLY